MRLKTRLKALVEGTLETTVVKPDFEESRKVRQQIKEWMQLPLDNFLKFKFPFNPRHGLVYKLLKTDPQRLKNKVLTANDMNYWLRQDKPLPALWVVRLGKHTGARNQFLRWSKEHLGLGMTRSVYNYTKKWGIPEDRYSLVEMTVAQTVAQARTLYASARERDLPTKSRQVLGNALLKQVAKQDADEVFAFYKSLNKDVQTFQIMFAAMSKNRALKKYWAEVWETCEKQQAANNLRIDNRLRETAMVAKPGGGPGGASGKLASASTETGDSSKN